ncbi:type VI secretion system baseplate subunit TssE [Burkholderia stagnalis]|uniref:type VI secretion system baseplate subunit TssE n=1 Tax=Burkholderia stagnalis TaxID=1503054 RepID=UPI00075EBB95|nr:type VI secretion system baseplate subunit TssE [Burkholderia stagnalis]KVM90601.1 type VI secretion protein [Burkholderia stagnalis]KWD96948.1 type VI secretion protein [Burkholderia stagnalis]KWE11883.1 type VI secretion protein [Burkholderia stagnalis]KWK13740.1 type VI secretion protein [Burkholderia stagnalis]KWO24970.1 type VI secretion protein [Burkholderia stagnalis]
MDDTRPRAGREAGMRDRLQPALLDRLTDAEPQRRTEPPDAQWVGAERLRAAVLRDLAWLLNTRNAEDGFVDWHAYPHAQASVINYGMRPLVGKPMSGVERLAVEASIRDAIVRFEPRIAPESVEVRSVPDTPGVPGGAAGEQRHNVLMFEIRGTLWSVPHPIAFVLRSALDLETGAMSLHSAAGG